MTLADYKIFVTVAECKSITVAAEKLYLTKSAISHAITRIERQLCFPLFFRKPQRWILTAEAEDLLPLAYAVLNANDHFDEQVSSVQGLTSGRVTLGTCSSTCINWLPDILNSFRAVYPYIKVEVRGGASNQQILQWLDNNEIDIGIAAPNSSENIEVLGTYMDEMVCVTNQRFLTRQKGIITAEELADYPIVIAIGDMGEESSDILRALKITPTSNIMAYDDASVIAMVEGGLGYCIVGKLILRSLSASVNIYHFDPPCYRHLCVLCREKTIASPAMKTLSQHIVQYISSFLY